jgi:hypothetical protein
MNLMVLYQDNGQIKMGMSVIRKRLGVPVSFFFVGRWLYDGHKQDKKRQERLNAIK